MICNVYEINYCFFVKVKLKQNNADSCKSMLQIKVFM